MEQAQEIADVLVGVRRARGRGAARAAQRRRPRAAPRRDPPARERGRPARPRRGRLPVRQRHRPDDADPLEGHLRHARGGGRRLRDGGERARGDRRSSAPTAEGARRGCSSARDGLELLRRAPRRAPSPRRARGSTSAPSAGRSRPAGRPAPPRARRARPPPPRSRASSCARLASRCAFVGFGAAGAAGLRPSAPARRLRALGLALELRPLLAHAHVLGPAADVGVQRPVLDRDRARADRVEQRAVVGDEQQRAREGLQRRLERLAALEVEVVRRLVEDEHVGARLDEHGEREPPALAAAQAVDAASRPPRR